MMERNDTAESSASPEVPGQLSADEAEEILVDKIWDNLKEARRHFSAWRTRAREDYDFFAGTQWDEADAAKLRNEKRPVVTFNRVCRTINAVAGLELQNRQEVRYLPRKENAFDANQQGQSDAGYADLLTSAAKWVRDNCDAEDEESEAFQDCLISGIGWTETRMDYETDPEGMVMEDRVDPLEMLVDPRSKKRNFQDAKWVAHIKEMSRQEILELWPDTDLEKSSFWNDSEGEPHDAQNAWKYENDQSDKHAKSGIYSIVQYQWWEHQKYYVVASNSGNVMNLESDKFDALKGFIDQNKLQYTKMQRKVFKQAFLAGKKLLEQTTIGCDHFTFRGITGLRDRNQNHWFGLVALMKDPQRWANKWLSQIQNIVNKDTKNGLLVEQGTITNMRKFEENYAKPGSISEVAQGALSGGKVQPKGTPSYPEGIDRLLQYAIQSINDVPGVNLETLGTANRDQAFVLEQSRKEAGVTILANFFDSLRRYRKEQGRVLAYFIREFISDGRLIKIVGEEGAIYVPLIKDAMSFKYDIVVDDSPTSPNMKEKAFGVLSQLVPLALQSGIPVPPEILDYAPLPENLIQKWKQLIVSGQKDPQQDQLKQIQMMLHQLDIQQKQADVQKTESETSLNYARSQETGSSGQVAAYQAQNDQAKLGMQMQAHSAKLGMDNQAHQNRMAMDMQANQLKAEQMQRDQHRKDIETVLNQKRKMLEVQLDAKLRAQDKAVPKVASVQ